MEKYESNIDKLYITELYSSIICDKVFPVINKEVFRITKVSDFKKEKDSYFGYFTCERRKDINDRYENNEDNQYKGVLIDTILKNGLVRDDRTGVGTLKLFWTRYNDF